MSTWSALPNAVWIGVATGSNAPVAPRREQTVLTEEPDPEYSSTSARWLVEHARQPQRHLRKRQQEKHHEDHHEHKRQGTDDNIAKRPITVHGLNHK